MSDAVSFMIMDVETGNATGFFDMHSDAVSALVALGEVDPKHVDEYAILGIDESGMSVGDAEYLSDLRLHA